MFVVGYAKVIPTTIFNFKKKKIGPPTYFVEFKNINIIIKINRLQEMKKSQIYKINIFYFLIWSVIHFLYKYPSVFLLFISYILKEMVIFVREKWDIFFLYSYRRLPVSAILKKVEVFIPSPHLTSTLDRSQMLGALMRPSSIYRQLFEWNP